MTGFDDTQELPESGTKKVRLFPLPNLVLFPHVVQPLHVFEPRYCEMLHDALAGDQLIATALLEPGWEGEDAQRPPIADTVCVGRVVSHSREGHGRHNILLLGVRRGRVRHELPGHRPYREAEVRLMGDYYAAASAESRRQVRRELADGFRAYLPKNPALLEQFEQLLNSRVPLGVLTDIMAFALNLDLRVKQQLLHQVNVDRRAATLLERLRRVQPEAPPPRFPPEFSEN